MHLRDPYLEAQLANHRKDFDENNIRDFTDALIKVTYILLNRYINSCQEASPSTFTTNDTPYLNLTIPEFSFKR